MKYLLGFILLLVILPINSKQAHKTITSSSFEKNGYVFVTKMHIGAGSAQIDISYV
jgi:hypothetical protein